MGIDEAEAESKFGFLLGALTVRRRMLDWPLAWIVW